MKLSTYPQHVLTAMQTVESVLTHYSESRGNVLVFINVTPSHRTHQPQRLLHTRLLMLRHTL